jgi:hypothetical protein
MITLKHEIVEKIEKLTLSMTLTFDLEQTFVQVFLHPFWIVLSIFGTKYTVSFFAHFCLDDVIKGHREVKSPKNWYICNLLITLVLLIYYSTYFLKLEKLKHFDDFPSPTPGLLGVRIQNPTNICWTMVVTTFILSLVKKHETILFKMEIIEKVDHWPTFWPLTLTQIWPNFHPFPDRPK